MTANPRRKTSPGTSGEGSGRTKRQRAGGQATRSPGTLADLVLAITTAELVAHTHRHRNAVGRWKSGEALPRPGDLPAIARALGIPLDQVRAAYANDFRARAKTKRRSA